MKCGDERRRQGALLLRAEGRGRGKSRGRGAKRGEDEGGREDGRAVGARPAAGSGSTAQPPRYLQPTGNAKQRRKITRRPSPRRRGGRRGERPSRERSSWDERSPGTAPRGRAPCRPAHPWWSGELSDDEDDVDALLAEGERMQQQGELARGAEEAKSLADGRRSHAGEAAVLLNSVVSCA